MMRILGALLAVIAARGVVMAQLPDPAPPDLTVAVVEFVANDASGAADAAGVRARLVASGKSPEAWLAARFAESGRYTPLPAANVTAALAAAGTTPGDCNDVACAVQLGRALGAARVVTGRVSKLSNLIWFLDATLVEVRAGRALEREQFEIKGDITTLLPQAMTALSRRLIAHDPAEGAAAQRLTRADVLATIARATPPTRPSFVGRDLSGLDLSGVDFQRADLSHAQLSHTNLSRAQLFAATLSDAVASDADLSDANLDMSVLYRIDLRRARLEGASLFGAIATGADLSGADLRNARLLGALAHANFQHATLAGANMGADPGNQPISPARTSAPRIFARRTSPAPSSPARTSRTPISPAPT
jgi:uncharacterized protein YjbI with pentapeptide repeats